SQSYRPGDNIAYPHTSEQTNKLQVVPFQNLDIAGPAGSINSSAADMARWALLQLNRGKLPDRPKRLFSEAQSQEMWTSQTIMPNPDPAPSLAALKPNFFDYALGWMVRDYRGRKLVTHTGGLLGFVSRIMLVPQENLGVVILTNAEERGAYDSILYHVLDHYFQLPPTDWIAAFKAAKDLQEKNAAVVEARQNKARNAS